MAAILGVTATIWLVDGINHLFKDSNEFIFLLIAGIIFIWFALISYLLIKIFRQSRFYIIPMAIGAWLAGLALAAFTLVFWETISLVIGIIFVAFAIVLLKNRNVISFDNLLIVYLSVDRLLSYFILVQKQIKCYGF